VLPSQKLKNRRICGCRSDLGDNGINVDRLGQRAVCNLARRNLDYFQFMLGYDAGLGEVVGLLERTRAATRDRPSGRAPRRIAK